MLFVRGCLWLCVVAGRCFSLVVVCCSWFVVVRCHSLLFWRCRVLFVVVWCLSLLVFRLSCSFACCCMVFVVCRLMCVVRCWLLFVVCLCW